MDLSEWAQTVKIIMHYVDTGQGKWKLLIMDKTMHSMDVSASFPSHPDAWSMIPWVSDLASRNGRYAWSQKHWFPLTKLDLANAVAQGLICQTQRLMLSPWCGAIPQRDCPDPWWRVDCIRHLPWWRWLRFVLTGVDTCTCIWICLPCSLYSASIILINSQNA